ncbi:MULTISPECIES: Cof-type HAD-IIB family hydrolase [unclassified Enterococcus]|uniref:Cof-type HAD-IIB family hydrolase n=1 Tax=unclassified Enterococcus TaxID=2608891 RepID=UPI00155431CD|nr:Cof-type HAD-IIB family hydrolase [Enterococcus sp. MMGLQ5-2]MBS7583924.1 Cof-type HAD-IIB family hydrolase [Enterococcus sp. MMGLQ5-1]NPD11785.1 Cof-type HAD-IIB family hydrolase [Enterococcus sp. MMGLQ5-1]NPD36426.1 Cof-type HAD-IIB family hydrolase [Enterococcus sp. MMGLQ5-2]
MDQKVVFLDVDGTIVTYENVIPASAIEAIRAARQNGHLVYMNTGRSRAEIPEALWEIGFDGLIGGNGSYVESQNQIIMHQVISEADSRAIVDWLIDRKLEFYIETNDGLFASHNFKERSQSTFYEYARGKGMAESEAKALDATTALHGVVFDGNLYRNDVNKVSFILESYEDYLAAKTDFSHLKVGTWGGLGEKALFGDIGVAGIDKKIAVKALVESLGIDLSQTIAFGDAKIDIPMLEVSQIGVAMGNGGAEIKAMADYITDDVAENGLKNAFVHFDLI